jgi:stalled ribosome rescue protein Dom34
MTPEEQKVETLDTALTSERDDFSAKILDLIKNINEVSKIAEAQVLMLSYRHMMVDKITKYRVALYKKKTSDTNYRKLRYEYYKTQHDVRLDNREINQYIDSDMALRIRQTELLESQVNFFQQCVENLDKMGLLLFLLGVQFFEQLQ